mmetsp:Transcript_8431/g.23793  ORF Transcript_8431/g.23793 Transcript_8431/m.23793 type:complete len:331 (+) Transcript_8431:74-1066(+)
MTQFLRWCCVPPPAPQSVESTAATQDADHGEEQRGGAAAAPEIPGDPAQPRKAPQRGPELLAVVEEASTVDSLVIDQLYTFDGLLEVDVADVLICANLARRKPKGDPDLELPLEDDVDTRSGTQRSEGPPTCSDDTHNTVRVGGAASADSTLSTFDVTITRAKAKAAIGADALPMIDNKALVVTHVSSRGPVQQWNANCKQQDSEGRIVKVGYRIIEVNGVVHDSRQMLLRMKSDSVLNMVLGPPREYWVLVRKNAANQKLGMSITVASDGLTCIVTQIFEGPVWNWNMQNLDHQVWPGNYIVEVNGVRNNSQKMFSLLKTADSLEMLVW